MFITDKALVQLLAQTLSSPREMKEQGQQLMKR